MADETTAEPTELTDEQLEFLNSLFDRARNGQTDELLGLIDQGIPVNLTNAQGDTLLILAAYNDHADLALGLIQREADVDRLNDRGQGALSCAVFRQNQQITSLLLEAGADPHLGEQSAYAVIDIFGLDSMRSLIDQYVQEI
ncbi:ankyrin repeat domain-containing protein [Nesterenkonia muleiensis]|uniref:ankyrin repeat domain-containing protein n=1 Tax=Nesterenkonia muleiensis TaxID=2282648 RepID=UPI000E7177E1|nr:ankyrin repeat domain-containing protein [Nesterenkonia muleiensis]